MQRINQTQAWYKFNGNAYLIKDFRIKLCTIARGGDNLHFLDFGHTQPTVGAKHKINDFCFLDFFISMKNTPYQGQKTKFCRFELCGISLAMLWWAKWHVLQNLSLISIIMMIREKKIGTLSTEIGPVAIKIVKFWPKKAYISMGT